MISIAAKPSRWMCGLAAGKGKQADGQAVRWRKLAAAFFDSHMFRKRGSSIAIIYFALVAPRSESFVATTLPFLKSAKAGHVLEISFHAQQIVLGYGLERQLQHEQPMEISFASLSGVSQCKVVVWR